MQDETARVEDALLDRNATAAIMNCFVQSSGSHLEKVIDRFVPIYQYTNSADEQSLEGTATIGITGHGNLPTAPPRTSLYFPLQASQGSNQTKRPSTHQDLIRKPLERL